MGIFYGFKSCSACFVDSFGRKGVLVISLAMASLCALIFALEIQNANSVVIITCACLFNMFSISSWNVVRSYYTCIPIVQSCKLAGCTFGRIVSH